MRVDGNIGGGIDGTGGGDLAGIAEQVAAAERAGYDGALARAGFGPGGQAGQTGWRATVVRGGELA